MRSTSIPVQPRTPDTPLRVIIIGRISTEQQNEENIAASYRYVEQQLAQFCQGPMEIERLGERASGLLADRATIRRVEQRIAEGSVDIIVAEDLSRIFRNPRHQYVFVQNCVDAGVRLLCLADHLDTGDPNWEVMLATAAIRHGLFVPDTRRRVRRTATHSFHNGGMVLRVRYGYRKLSQEQALSGHFGPPGLRLAKVPECTPTIEQICEWVRSGVSYVRIAERLNHAGIEPGPYSKQKRWTRANVIDLLRDPILSGTRRFRVVMYEPVYGTGRHRRRKSAEPEAKCYPELAHITLDEQQEIWRLMDARAEAWRPSTQRPSKRRNVPRSRAFWPGQSATCGICGGLMYDMGSFLKCRNALPAATHRCWNHVHVPIALSRRKVVDWLWEQLSSVSGLSEALQALVTGETERLAQGAQSELAQLDRQITELEVSVRNLTKAIAQGGQLEVLLDELKSHQTELDRLQQARRETNEITSSDPVNLDLRNRFLQLLDQSHEFGDAVRAMIPKFRIVPVQALDTPLVRPRARLSVRISVTPKDPQSVPCENGFSGMLDLFAPPEPVRWREPCVAIRKAEPNCSLKQIAARLGIGHMTVKRALHYDRLMREAGLASPYRVLTEPPSKASRWCARRRQTEKDS